MLAGKHCGKVPYKSRIAAARLFGWATSSTTCSTHGRNAQNQKRGNAVCPIIFCALKIWAKNTARPNALLQFSPCTKEKTWKTLKTWMLVHVNWRRSRCLPKNIAGIQLRDWRQNRIFHFSEKLHQKKCRSSIKKDVERVGSCRRFVFSQSIWTTRSQESRASRKPRYSSATGRSGSDVWRSAWT